MLCLLSAQLYVFSIITSWVLMKLSVDDHFKSALICILLAILYQPSATIVTTLDFGRKLELLPLILAERRVCWWGGICFFLKTTSSLFIHVPMSKNSTTMSSHLLFLKKNSYSFLYLWAVEESALDVRRFFTTQIY